MLAVAYLGKLSQVFGVPSRKPLEVFFCAGVPFKVPQISYGTLSPLVGGKRSLHRASFSVLQAMLSLGILAALSRVFGDPGFFVLDHCPLGSKRVLPFSWSFFSGDRSPADPLDFADPVSLQIRDCLTTGFPWPC